MRRSWPALREGQVQFAAASRDVLLVLRHCPEQSVLLAVNRSREEQRFTARDGLWGPGPVQASVPAEKAIFIEIQKEICL